MTLLLELWIVLIEDLYGMIRVERQGIMPQSVWRFRHEGRGILEFR